MNGTRPANKREAVGRRIAARRRGVRSTQAVSRSQTNRRRFFLRNSRWSAIAVAMTLLVGGCDSSVSPRVDGRADSGEAAAGVKRISLVVGEERQLTATKPVSQLTWQSENPVVAAVSATGILSARTPGATRVIARGSAAETTFVTVHRALLSVQFLADTTTIAVGASTRLATRVADSSGATVDDPDVRLRLRWSSTSSDVAAIDSTGALSARAIGQTTIVVALDGAADSTIVEVTDAMVAKVIVNAPAVFGISVGATYPLHAIARDAAGNELAGRSFVWSTSNATIAKVSQDGLITGMSSGMAQISVVSDGRGASVGVVVTSAVVARVAVSFSSASLGIGQTARAVATAQDVSGNPVTGKNVEWSSDASNVATVSAQGVVEGVGPGSARITATVDGVAGSAPLDVFATGTTSSSAKVATVVVVVTPSTFAVGHTAQAVATPLDSAGKIVTGRTIAWSALNLDIATVSAAGLVTGLSAGSATIRATIDGVAGQMSLSVSSPSIITEPAPTSGTLASSDFESGNITPFSNPWGTGIDVLGDPTGGGHGQVARYHYSTSGTTQVDDNKALFPQPTLVARGLGQEVWFQGDVYLDATARMDPSGPAMVQRKLVRFGSNGLSFPHPLETELTAFGPQLALVFQPEQKFTQALGTGALFYISTPGSTLTVGGWHRIKMYQKINSAYGLADGVLRVWYDGVLIFDRGDLRWSDPSWTDDPGTYVWNSWGVGYQVNGPLAIDENRYWDNIIFSQAPIP